MDLQKRCGMAAFRELMSRTGLGLGFRGSGHLNCFCLLPSPSPILLSLSPSFSLSLCFYLSLSLSPRGVSGLEIQDFRVREVHRAAASELMTDPKYRIEHTFYSDCVWRLGLGLHRDAESAKPGL